MAKTDLSSLSCDIIARLALGLVLLAVAGKGQTAPQSAAGIIRFLSDPVSQPGLLDKNGGRKSEADRAAANSLVALGPAAIRDLDSVFDVIERQESPLVGAMNSKWLLVAYARIRGPAAYQRLRAMANNPQLRYLYGDLDLSIAVALDLTSYVSGDRVADKVLCCRFQEPRHALDQFILAWLQGNRLLLEDALGPRGRLALDSLLARGSWLDLWAEMWHGAPSSRLSVGYRFGGSDDWSKPEETLDQGLQDRRHSVDLGKLTANPDLLTQFVGISGGSCGSREIRFTRVSRAPGGILSKYVIDCTDLRGLLRLITDCAVTEPTHGNQ
jgi:hypothetical protein